MTSSDKLRVMVKKDELPKLLTIRQAAEILNVHIETLRRWDKRGKSRAIRAGARHGVGASPFTRPLAGLWERKTLPPREGFI